MVVRIGVIDSGVPGFLVSANAAKNFSDSDNQSDELGHSSAVISRIETSGITIEYCIAKVFSDRLVCEVEQCTTAIRWLIDQNPVFINMSFGLRRDDPALQLVCDAAQEAGIGIVAASPAQGAHVYPAAYAGVLRATGDARCRPGEIAWLDTVQADVAGYVGDPAIGPAGASIGCASVSARLAAIADVEPELTFSHLVELLAAEAEYQGPEHRQ